VHKVQSNNELVIQKTLDLDEYKKIETKRPKESIGQLVRARWLSLLGFLKIKNNLPPFENRMSNFVCCSVY
jgi:hypothetical protein